MALRIEHGFRDGWSLLDIGVSCSGRGSLVEVPVDRTLDNWEQSFYPGGVERRHRKPARWSMNGNHLQTRTPRSA